VVQNAFLCSLVFLGVLGVLAVPMPLPCLPKPDHGGKRPVIAERNAMQNQILTEEPQLQSHTPVLAATPENTFQETGETIALESSELQQEQAIAEFVAKRKQRARRLRFSLPPSIPMFALSMLLGRLHLPGATAIGVTLFIGSILYTLGMLIFSLWGSKTEIEELVQKAGVRAIGPLLDMRHGFANQKQTIAMYEALIELLPQLKSRDVNLLHKRHRDFLYEILEGVGQAYLSSDQQKRLTLAILEAMVEVGDVKAFQIMHRLAKVWFWQRKPTEVQLAAQRNLPLLAANLAHILSTQTLLRASTGEAMGSDTLLRAAAPTEEHEPEQLLRASNSTSS
jgi:hypothetical protein